MDLAREFLIENPNLRLEEFTKRYRERYGQAPVRGGKLRAWLLSIRGVRVDDKDRITVEPDFPCAVEKPHLDPIDIGKHIERCLKWKPFHIAKFKRALAKTSINEAMILFWETFDPFRWSIWLCEYKDSQELDLTTESVNKIYGAATRLESFRKRVFASLCLFEGDDHSTISGIWIWKSHELLLNGEVWEDQSGCYTWEKLDPDNSNTRALVHQYFCLEGDFEGKTLLSGMIFQ